MSLIDSLNDSEAMKLAQSRSWYHTIEFPGFVTDGEFDIRPVLDQYGFPEDLTGKRVLDVGRSSGYFAFEFARRGAASVIATELHDGNLDKDFVGGDIVRNLVERWVVDQYERAGADPSKAGQRDDFYLGRRLMGLEDRVTGVTARVTDLRADLKGHIGGGFDLVFCGSLLNHVRDVARAWQELAAVTSDLCIVANPVSEDESQTPRLEYRGANATGLTTWWVANVAAHKALAEQAGFADVQVYVERLPLPMRGGRTMDHSILHCRKGSTMDGIRRFLPPLERKYPGITEIAEASVR